MNWKKIIRVVSLLTLSSVVVWLMMPKSVKEKEDKNAASSQQKAAALPVTAFIAKITPVNDVVVATGTVLPDEMVDMASEVSGRIVRIHFSEGKSVRKGDLLVSLNNADLQAQQERNRYQLALAHERERRQRVLLESEGISQQTYDQTLTELNSLKAEALLIQAQLDKTLVKVPFDGIVGLRMLSEGAYVSPGTKIVKIVRNKPVKIDFSIPERYVQFVKKGTPVRFSIEGSEQLFDARVEATEAMVDQRSRSLMARAIYPNHKGEVVPGMFARVELSANGLIEALQIPARAIIPEMGTSKVFVYRNGKAEPVVITPGLRTSSMVQVLTGLMPNDTVITSGLLQLRPGMVVQLKNVQQP
jgi:membrane fusion protein (multidrug efflux system)